MGLYTKLALGKTKSPSSTGDGKTEKQKPEQTNERTFKQTSVQTNERSNEQDYKPTKRASFDIYFEQEIAIDDLVNKKKSELGRHVKKGEVMREIINFYFSQKS